MSAFISAGSILDRLVYAVLYMGVETLCEVACVCDVIEFVHIKACSVSDMSVPEGTLKIFQAGGAAPLYRCVG